MLEVKITVVAPDLTNAISNLAIAFGSKIVEAPQPQVATPLPPAPVSASMSVPTNPAPIPAAPAQSQQPTTPIAGVPLADAPQFTVDQIMAAGATLMDAGRVSDLMNLLHSFGVQAVMDLKPEQLGAFATEMRKLGAAI